MGISDNIVLKEIDDKSAAQLTEILNTDVMLQDRLGSRMHKISKERFIEYNNQWAKAKNADMFAIALNNTAIGMISLSHQNIKQGEAQIGYWIRSSCWGNGYTSQAFSELLDFADKKGIKYLSATIDCFNLGSKKIWEKHGAKVELVDDKYHVSLVL